MRRVIFLFVVFSMLTCRRETQIHKVIYVCIDYENSAKIRSYTKVQNGDTIEYSQYNYDDSGVTRYVYYHQGGYPDNYHIRYAIPKGTSRAVDEWDTAFDGGTPLLFYVTEHHFIYDASGYLNETHGRWYQSDSGRISREVELVSKQPQYKNGDLMSVYGGTASNPCVAYWDYHETGATLFGNRMMEPFYGKYSTHLEKYHSQACNNGPGRSSGGYPQYKYEYVIDVEGVVREMKETTGSSFATAYKDEYFKRGNSTRYLYTYRKK